MMGTKSLPIHAGLLAVLIATGVVANAHALPKALLDRVSLIDAKSPGSAAVISGQPMGGHTLRFYRLSSSTSTEVECCVSVGEGAVPSTALRYQGSDTVAVTARQATFDGPLERGFVGLALAGPGVRVQRINAHKISLSWKYRRGKVVVEHCLSQEGVHVRMSDASQSQHYYLPLDMEVEPNCPSSMVP